MRLSDAELEALIRLRGEQSEADFLRAVIVPVLGGLAPTPQTATTHAVIRHLNRVAARLVAWQGELELVDAERVVCELLGDGTGSRGAHA